jgi:rfaE bifunctional protein kinase chain/domain
VPSDNLRSRLLSIVDRFAGRRIAVAGDFVLDRFVHGLPKRISREAPVLILKYASEQNVPGGGANTAANIAALGGLPRTAGAIGRDEEGRTLESLLARAGGDVSGLLPVEGYATPTKTRILGGAPHAIKQQIVRYDIDEPLGSDTARDAALSARLAAAARGADGAILSDYGYGTIAPAAVAGLRASLPSGARIFVDSRHRLAEFAGVDAATPNEEELEESAGAVLDSDEALASAGARLRSRMRCACLLVTRGSRGMALFSDSDAPLAIPVHGTDQVADVTGAGDTVLATFALALSAGASPLEAALLANFAGGVVVMKIGTAVVTPSELAAAVEADRALLS